MIDPMPEESTVSRREFVTGLTALGAVWLAASACAKEAPKAVDSSASAIMPMANDSTSVAQTLTHFSAEQAAEVEAIASRIIPTDDTPGAKEAGVVYFIDHAMQPGGVAAEQAPLFAAGLESLSKAVAKQHGATAKFSTLSTAQQDALLKGIEKTPFFGAMRFATIAGFLALPKYGGNKDYVGWKVIGQEHTYEQKSPFGWYDQPENQKALLGRVL